MWQRRRSLELLPIHLFAAGRLAADHVAKARLPSLVPRKVLLILAGPGWAGQLVCHKAPGLHKLLHKKKQEKEMASQQHHKIMVCGVRYIPQLMRRHLP